MEYIGNGAVSFIKLPNYTFNGSPYTGLLDRSIDISSSGDLQDFASRYPEKLDMNNKILTIRNGVFIDISKGGLNIGDGWLDGTGTINNDGIIKNTISLYKKNWSIGEYGITITGLGNHFLERNGNIKNSTVNIANSKNLILVKNLLPAILLESQNQSIGSFIRTLDLSYNIYQSPVSNFDIFNNMFKNSPVISIAPISNESIVTFNFAIKADKTDIDDGTISPSLVIGPASSSSFYLVLSPPHGSSNNSSFFSKVFVAKNCTLHFSGSRSLFSPKTLIYGDGDVVFSPSFGSDGVFLKSKMPKLNIKSQFYRGALLLND